MSRGIDILVVRHVMNLGPNDWREDNYPCIEVRRRTDEGEEVWNVFSPSEDATDAIEVADKMRADGWNPVIHAGEGDWTVAWSRFEGSRCLGSAFHTSRSFAEAVCVGALRVLGIPEEEIAAAIR